MAGIKDDFRLCGMDTQEFFLMGQKCWARVVHCHDGDSPTIVLPVLGRMFRFNTRLYGIDTCEITSKVAANRDIAVRGRNRLLELIMGTPLPSGTQLNTRKDIQALLASDVYLVWVECMEMDKYGRVLVKMKMSEHEGLKSFADILVEERLAYSYFGATKLTEAEQLVRLQM